MPKLQDMICTKQTAAKLSEWSKNEIVNVVLDGDLVAVTNFTGFTRKLRKVDFIAEFVKSRKQRAAELTVIQTQNPYVFEVSSGSGNKPYTLLFTKFGVICNCTDFANQLEAFDGDSCCKHAYAGLHTIGFESLKAYREAWAKPGATLASIIKRK